MVGQKYWYRLVAVDRSGNRSDPSWARQVTVLNAPIPIPGKPSLKVEKEPCAMYGSPSSCREKDWRS